MPLATCPTPLGLCAIAWHETVLTRFLLPDPLRITTGGGEIQPPPWVATIMQRVHFHLGGQPQDFADLPFDFSQVTAFAGAVLRATLAIKSGTTATYGDLAAALGNNPWPLLIPCDRIVAANGKMTGFSGPGGVATKIRLLAM